MRETERFIDYQTGQLRSVRWDALSESVKTLDMLAGMFENEAARASMPQNTVVYRVQMSVEEKEGTPNGLLFGTSFVCPGFVGDEYFMTKGHFHALRDCAEYYWCWQGEGALILMDEDGRCTAQRMTPGSLHYIPGHIAHRLANTGSGILAVGACWPSDAGHDYGTIARTGFSARLKAGKNGPVLVTDGGKVIG